MPVRTKIDLNNFQKTVTRHTSATRQAAYSSLKERVEELKNKLISNFQSHGITRELLDHSEPSNYLSGKNHGTLFGFIGFNAGSEPIADVLGELERIFVENSPQDLPIKQKGRLSYRFPVCYPTKKILDQVAKMPKWTGGNWINAIEEGISGLNFYMGIFGTAKSLSKEGFQSKSEVKNIQFRPVDNYLPSMLKEFKAALRIVDES